MKSAASSPTVGRKSLVNPAPEEGRWEHSFVGGKRDGGGSGNRGHIGILGDFMQFLLAHRVSFPILTRLEGVFSWPDSINN